MPDGGGEFEGSAVHIGNPITDEDDKEVDAENKEPELADAIMRITCRQGNTVEEKRLHRYCQLLVEEQSGCVIIRKAEVFRDDDGVAISIWANLSDGLTGVATYLRNLCSDVRKVFPDIEFSGAGYMDCENGVIERVDISDKGIEYAQYHQRLTEELVDKSNFEYSD